jgi:putative heme-binding domain-containing protein
MYGALYVVPKYSDFVTSQSEYLDELDLDIKDRLLQSNSRGQQWKYDDIISDLNELMGRSHEVGEASFQAANCIACHRFGGHGQNFGPDLSKLSEKKLTASHILRSILEPSKDIDENFSSNIFLLDSGKTITGMIMEETDDVLKIIVDPLAKDQITVINQDEIDGRKKSTQSQMPAGMIDKLSREEIIDLIAYVLSNANPKDKMFQGGHQHKADH